MLSGSTAISGLTRAASSSPNGFAPNVVRRQISSAYIRQTMDLCTNLPLREGFDEPNDQPESLCVFLVNYDGVNPASSVTDYPALTPDSPHHYGNFLRRMARLYEERFPS